MGVPKKCSQFIAVALQDWLRTVGINPIQIYPGSPWENGDNERFNGMLRREVPNADWFHTTRQAQIVINTWLRQYSRADHIRRSTCANLCLKLCSKVAHRYGAGQLSRHA